MKSALFVFLVGLISCSASTVDEDDDDGTPQDEWELVWSDEFDYTGLPDPQKWSYDVGGHGWGNQESQYYTADRAQNARVAAGILTIEARKEAFEGSAYTSARLVTKGKGDWVYGKFEIRAKLPSGRGTWPAIWMLATHDSYGDGYWPDNGEIDIMEHVGFNPDVVHATVHTLAYNHTQGTQVGTSMQVPTARSEFHVYTVEWEEDEIRAYIDGEEYFSFPNERLTEESAGFREWQFDRPFHLILNIAVGGAWGGQQGIDDSVFPQAMEVDYVRVYQR